MSVDTTLYAVMSFVFSAAGICLATWRDIEPMGPIILLTVAFVALLMAVREMLR